MHTVKLSTAAPPEAFLRDNLRKNGANPQDIKPLSQSSVAELKAAPATATGLVMEGRLIAAWDSRSGESQILPQLDKLPPVHYTGLNDQHIPAAVAVAKSVFTTADFLPKDVSQYQVSEGRPVVGRSAKVAASGMAPTISDTSLYLTYVTASRTVDGHPVYGIGSHVAVAVGTDNKVYGLVHRWKPAAFTGMVQEKLNKGQLQEALTATLKPFTTNSNVEVVSVEVAYADENEDAMVPVYRVVSRLHPLPVAGANAALLSTTDYVVTYFGYGGVALPANLIPGSGPKPSEPPSPRAAMPQVEVPAGDPTVGRYVVRNAQSGFVDEANGFWNGLASSSNASQFTNAQYYWAEPWMYTTNGLQFVNSVNVALTEAHGSPWSFTTSSNCCDVVDINGIPATQGYGGVTKGKLAYWIIHSCEVVPAAEDNASWFTPWFKVFQGMHAVMGSRTDMYFDGGAVNQPFGQSIGNGGSVIGSWFNATLSYYPDSKQPPIDRPSAVTECGHEPDTVFNTAPLAAASCLTNYWAPN